MNAWYHGADGGLVRVRSTLGGMTRGTGLVALASAGGQGQDQDQRVFPSPLGGVLGTGSVRNLFRSRTVGCLGLLGVAVLVGCKTGPDYRRADPPLPAAYQHSPSVVATEGGGGVALARWWRVFEDPILDELMGWAADANLEVRVARARVEEVRALRGIVRSALFPGVEVAGSVSSSRWSENTIQGGQLQAFGQDLEQELYRAGAEMSWEVDVFGGRRRANESAAADVEASEEVRRDVLVAVLAEVGSTYLELRGAQRQRAVALENLRAQEQTAALTRDRYGAGLVSELDTTRSEAQVALTRAQIPPLAEACERAMHRLGVLLGRNPGELVKRLSDDTGQPTAVPAIPVGLPSDLLRQRPDIRRAERQVASASAQVGVATAELFPKFFLTGVAGLESVAAEDFAMGGSRFWSLGPSLRWPVFTAGRIRQQIRAANARHEQALLRYEQVVLTSLEEVENALLAFGQEQERRRALAASEAATRRSVALANERYRGGLVDFLDVLEAERSLLSIQDSVVQSDRRLGQQLVRLYRALGGGWEGGGEVVALDPSARASL